MFGEILPETIEGWIAKAIQFDTNYRIAKTITEQNRTMNIWKKNERWVMEPKKQKNNDEKVDKMLTIEERNILMKQGVCFKCRKEGHIAKDCPPDKGKTLTVPEKKSAAKDLVTQIQTMTKEEKMKFVELMDDEEKADF